MQSRGSPFHSWDSPSEPYRRGMSVVKEEIKHIARKSIGF